MRSDEQELLLSIVNAWDINPHPEYRGFRCANCQKYINEAYYHWLDSDMFFIPVHLCQECQQLFEGGKIKPKAGLKPWKNIKQFGKKFSKPAEAGFAYIVRRWNSSERPQLTAYYCDKCSKPLNIDGGDGMRKGYHVWWPHNNRLHELHFHKTCGDSLMNQS